jgi:hypothetical protein
MTQDQSRREVEERARRHIGDDRRLSVKNYWAHTVDFDGATLAYISDHTEAWEPIFHADPDCPHFPEKPVSVYTLRSARRSFRARPCEYCTLEGEE